VRRGLSHSLALPVGFDQGEVAHRARFDPAHANVRPVNHQMLGPSSLALSATNMMIGLHVALPNVCSAHVFAAGHLIGAPQKGAKTCGFCKGFVRYFRRFN